MVTAQHVCLALLACIVATAMGLTVPKYPQMMEVSARPWLYELSAKYNRQLTALADIPDQELTDLARRGVNVLWVMGVWRLGAYGLNHDRTDSGLLQTFRNELPDFTLSDVIGSPYAPMNYSCNPVLCPNGDQDLSSLRARLNSLGMLLMLDFVPNHSACDSEWIAQPDLYVRAPKGQNPPYDSSKYLPSGIAFGNCDPNGGAWTDVAQLNYWNPSVWKLMENQLAHVASLADAIRCDMAYIMLNDNFQNTWKQQLSSWGWSRPSGEFWAEAIPSVKSQYPGTIFLAEVYGEDNARVLQNWFDFCYDKDLLDKLKSGDYNQFKGWIWGVGQGYLAKTAHFVENHDEDRAVATLGSWQRADAAAAISMTIPGMKFYFQDQWNGFKNKLDVHLRRGASESAVPDVQAFYQSLVTILTAEVFHDGTWTLLSATGGDSAWRIVTYKWTLGSEKRLVTVNFSDQSASGQIVLSDVDGNGSVTVAELVSGVDYVRDAPTLRSSGLGIVLAPWQTQIFSYP